MLVITRGYHFLAFLGPRAAPWEAIAICSRSRRSPPDRESAKVATAQFPWDLVYSQYQRDFSLTLVNRCWYPINIPLISQKCTKFLISCQNSPIKWSLKKTGQKPLDTTGLTDGLTSWRTHQDPVLRRDDLPDWRPWALPWTMTSLTIGPALPMKCSTPADKSWRGKKHFKARTGDSCQRIMKIIAGMV